MLYICPFTYAVYEYLTLVSWKQEKVKPDKLHALLPGLLGFLAVIFLIPVIVFAGQSFNGRETADETLKTILRLLLVLSFRGCLGRGF